MHNPITKNEQILGGIPVFTGTRVPVKTLFDYLDSGATLDDFFADFPTVSREQVMRFFQLASDALTHENPY